uniref:Uncharacterized protein n=1 Tax=Arundo donax TaxID=35708 RepID=A0A0A8YQA9_ARUDO
MKYHRADQIKVQVEFVALHYNNKTRLTSSSMSLSFCSIDLKYQKVSF